MGTHPIFESDFDCLTVCRTWLPIQKRLMIWKKTGRLSKSQLLSKLIPVQILEKHQLIMTKIEKNQRNIDVLDHVIVQDRTGATRKKRNVEGGHGQMIELKKEDLKEKNSEKRKKKLNDKGIDEDVKEKKLKENVGMKIEDEKLKDVEGCLPARHSEKDLEVAND